MSRLMAEFSWDEKKARQRIEESDSNRLGFHKSFFNLENEDPTHFHMVINSSLLNVDAAAQTIADFCAHFITPEKEAAGQKKISELLAAQHLVNSLIFEHKLNINFLRAVIFDKTITLQGVADSSALAEKAVAVASSLMPGYTVESAISVVQDFKAYP